MVQRRQYLGDIEDRPTRDHLEDLLPRDDGIEVFNVHRYGATGNDTADDHAAIQKAIDEAAETGRVRSGAVVQLRAKHKYRIGSSLQMRDRVWLRGTGRSSTIILEDGVNDDVVKLADGNTTECWVSDLLIDGNRSGNSSGHGINFDNNSDVGRFGLTNHWLSRLVVTECAQDGIRMVNEPGNSFLEYIHSQNNDGKGFNLQLVDSFVAFCHSGDSGLEGFEIKGPNTRYVGCKAFNAGQVIASRGDGFLITADRVHGIGCEAQDNENDGFEWNGASKNAWGDLIADSNNRANYKWDNADDGIFLGLQGVVRAGGTFTSDVHFEHFATSTGNSIEGIGDGSAGSLTNGDFTGSKRTIINGTFRPTDSYTVSNDNTDRDYDASTPVIGNNVDTTTDDTIEAIGDTSSSDESAPIERNFTELQEELIIVKDVLATLIGDLSDRGVINT